MKRVLLVEDDNAIMDSLRLALAERYEILQAWDGAAALAILEQQTVDCVLLDLMMPILDGESLMRLLAAKGIHPRVIVVSASLNLVARARAMGAVDSLRKPFELTVLEEKLVRAIAAGSGEAAVASAEGTSAPARAAAGR